MGNTYAQQGTAEVRLDAYKNLVDEVEQNTNQEEQDELYQYVKGSEPTNLLLRGQKQKDMYPHNKKVKDEALHTSKHVSSAIEKNRIQKDMNVFRGIPDSKLGEILAQKGLTRAIKQNGTLDHKWIRDNLEKVQRALINTSFADNGFTSTTTERSFANYWAQYKNHNEVLQRLQLIENRSPEEERDYTRFTEEFSPDEKNVPGGHVIKMFLPAGSRSAFIGGAAKIQGKAPTIKQHEVLVDKGSLFKITGFEVNNEKDAGPDSYNLMMELLSDEEGMEPTGNIAENLIQPNVGRIKKNLLDIRDYDDLSIDDDKESAANNLLEPIGDLDGEDLDLENNDDDMKVGVRSMVIQSSENGKKS